MLIYLALAFLIVGIAVTIAVVRSTQTVLNISPSSSKGERARLPSEALAQKLKIASRGIQAEFIPAGRVDYPALAASQRFAEYRELVSQLPLLDLTSLVNREEKLSFWINLYNSLVIDAVVEFQIKKRVWDTPTFFEKAAYRIGGFRFSLNDVENGILRANRKGPLSLDKSFGQSDPRLAFALSEREFDPRIHFALNCASRSCPSIHFYEAAQIDLQLETAARSFIETETQIEGDRLKTSAIFKWYRQDFGDDLQAFLEKYVSDEQRHQIAGKKMKIEFLKYDWGLNLGRITQ